MLQAVLKRPLPHTSGHRAADSAPGARVLQPLYSCPPQAGPSRGGLSLGPGKGVKKVGRPGKHSGVKRLAGMRSLCGHAAHIVSADLLDQISVSVRQESALRQSILVWVNACALKQMR